MSPPVPRAVNVGPHRRHRRARRGALATAATLALAPALLPGLLPGLVTAPPGTLGATPVPAAPPVPGATVAAPAPAGLAAVTARGLLPTRGPAPTRPPEGYAPPASWPELATVYGFAAQVVAPRCDLDPLVLAAMAQVGTQRPGGPQVDADHRAAPPVLGSPGRGARRAPDTDAGLLDGDPTTDRAVGPLGFAVPVWEAAKLDGDGDGARDPQDLDDAALAAAHLVCTLGGATSGDRTPDLRDGLRAMWPSREYADAVLAWRDVIASTWVVPTLPAATVPTVTHLGASRTRHPGDGAGARHRSHARRAGTAGPTGAPPVPPGPPAAAGPRPHGAPPGAAPQPAHPEPEPEPATQPAPQPGPQPPATGPTPVPTPEPTLEPGPLPTPEPTPVPTPPAPPPAPELPEVLAGLLAGTCLLAVDPTSGLPVLPDPAVLASLGEEQLELLLDVCDLADEAQGT